MQACSLHVDMAWPAVPGDHHPGASASRAYLEALADIPWGVDSGHRAAAGGKQPSPAVTPAGNSGEHQGADTSGPAPPQEGHGQRGPGSVAEPGGAPLSLKAARAVLDKQHYGLDKVKDRWVGGGWVVICRYNSTLYGYTSPVRANRIKHPYKFTWLCAVILLPLQGG
jgi:hypothetical protein